MNKKMIPNMLTIGNLFLGIMSMLLIYGGTEYIDYAALMIILAMVFDALDGRVARLLNAQSEFGKELDSLSDVVTFGVAPAIILFTVTLHEFGVIGSVVAALFPACGAIRLARFNSQSVPNEHFIGIPITAAGGILATCTLYNQFFSSMGLLLITIIVSYLMISNIPYPSFKKKKNFSKKIYFVIPVLLFTIVAILIKAPDKLPLLVFLPLLFYAVYGVTMAIKKSITNRMNTRRNKKDESAE